ncbi:carbamoyltransferase [bacterium]|nr:carbamoyltransferase [bacterium]
MKILGISSYYHDSASALLSDGEIIAAAQEERFTRKKHDPAFPTKSIIYCLNQARLELKDIDYVVFYDKPLVKFERLLETYLAYAPKGWRSFLSAMPVWIKEKLFLKKTLKQELAQLSGLPKKALPPLMFTEHHQAHAASAFFPSPFKKAAILCLDGVGEWATTTVWTGEANRLTPRWEINFPHSLGLLYSAFTYYAGFKVNSGEYKLMGLAPYGEPTYVDRIYEHLVDLKADGSFRLNMDYFNYATGLTMTNKRFATLFNGSPRKPESKITQREMDLARSIQAVTEDIILKIVGSIKEKFNVDHLCLAGGVALNCVANGELIKKDIFKNVWIQPAAGDAGCAIGAAYSIWYDYLEKERTVDNKTDATQGSYLGPSFTNSEITLFLDGIKANYRRLKDDQLIPKVADLVANGAVVGWFQGRMEFGPRALGGRSIIGDPRNKTMQAAMNLKIKYRESFRPFAPSVKAEAASTWFDMDGSSPYMLIVTTVNKEKQLPENTDVPPVSGLEKLAIPRSVIPAVTHVDSSARVQTVHRQTNPRYWNLLDHFERQTGCPVLINTSFNVRGEPIVCTPAEAYQCFIRTHMDYLVMENILLAKSDQPNIDQDDKWKQEFELD